MTQLVPVARTKCKLVCSPQNLVISYLETQTSALNMRMTRRLILQLLINSITSSVFMTYLLSAVCVEALDGKNSAAAWVPLLVIATCKSFSGYSHSTVQPLVVNLLYMHIFHICPFLPFFFHDLNYINQEMAGFTWKSDTRKSQELKC